MGSNECSMTGQGKELAEEAEDLVCCPTHIQKLNIKSVRVYKSARSSSHNITSLATQRARLYTIPLKM